VASSRLKTAFYRTRIRSSCGRKSVVFGRLVVVVQTRLDCHVTSATASTGQDTTGQDSGAASHPCRGQHNAHSLARPTSRGVLALPHPPALPPRQYGHLSLYLLSVLFTSLGVIFAISSRNENRIVAAFRS